MSVKGQYKTRQREELLTFLKQIPGRHVTAGDVAKYFKKEEIPIGTTTIYRHLEKLVDEGLVHKYVIDGNSSACFEYTGDKPNPDETTNFHCKCEQCGDLIHLECSELSSLKAHIEESHNFAINPMRTVFYGLCERCMKQNKHK